tara:strand:+ start:163 stop:339 length:177 start_codon:yes stop_codon:yes gene_type:complete
MLESLMNSGLIVNIQVYRNATQTKVDVVLPEPMTLSEANLWVRCKFPGWILLKKKASK